MNLSKKQWLLLLTVVIILFTIDPIYAGPGGTVAKVFFRTWWGKIILIVLTIILLPLIIYIKLIEYRKAVKIKKILAQLSVQHKELGWLHLHKEFSNIIRRVYNAWTNEDLSEVKNYMNHWYWQNQQMVFLDQWKRENVKNVSNLKEITKIKPIYLELTDEPNFEGSRIAIIINLVAEDYLMDRDTKAIVKGKSGYDDLEFVWFLEYTEGKWLLDDIQEGSLSLGIAKTPNVVPAALGVTI
ncbi:MAG: hypothetical protein ABIQ27_07175 [Flavobacterium sp.]|uniref:hypothetical protein n=1 Tax=Flavobacterium sp. TaxID=239 RepID=UPI003265D4DA